MRALVVDDSKPSRSIVARVLRDLSFECTEAANGMEALESLATSLATTGRPDLVTINWHMPVMDGLELIRRLRRDPAHRGLRLLMISTEHDHDRIAMALDAGADGYVSKPFTAAALTRKLVEMGVCREPAATAVEQRPIGVLICDDSQTIRSLLTSTLEADPDLRVVGAAAHGQACLDALRGDLPDIVLLDVEMPVMDGIQALREIRRRYPKLPVMMFSSLTERGATATVEALLAGANDYVPKPTGLNPQDVAARIRSEVVTRIKALVPRGSVGRAGATPAHPAGPRPAAARREPIRGIAIAVSTGGPSALAEVLPPFVAGVPVPVLIVQHMPPFFTAQLAERLTKICGVRVREAVDGETIARGDVVLARGGHHLELVQENGVIRGRLNDGPPENSCRPAADVLFRSAARLWGAGTLGVVLTGMGRDGLAGSKAIVMAGGSVIAQDEYTSVVWGMPGEVVRAGLADAVLPLAQIGVEVALRLKRRGG